MRACLGFGALCRYNRATVWWPFKATDKPETGSSFMAVLYCGIVRLLRPVKHVVLRLQAQNYVVSRTMKLGPDHFTCLSDLDTRTEEVLQLI